MENILENIETIRKEKHIKQEEIAAKLGIKQSSYSSFITRKRDITYSRMLQISKILGVSVIDLKVCSNVIIATVLRLFGKRCYYYKP